MLSKAIIRKRKVYEVCERSGDIESGETFKSVKLVEKDEFDVIPSGAKVVCCGKISNDEMLFRTEDGQYYFSLRSGWGKEDGVLYGLEQELFYDFKHPTTPETIIKECEANMGTYHSWAGAMLYHTRSHTLQLIMSVMKRYGK